jgi:hypothetical protein
MHIIRPAQAVRELYRRATGDANLPPHECGLIAPRSLPEQTLWHGLPRAHLSDIPPGEIADAVADRTRRRAWPSDRLEDLGAPVKDQGQTSYCWAHSLASGCECARIYDGRAYLELAPESLGGSVQWRNTGSTLEGAIEWARIHGIAPRAFVPNNVLDPKQYVANWDKVALNFRPLELIEIGTSNTWNDIVQILLHGIAVYAGYDWWGHAVLIVALTYVDNELCAIILNSWGKDWGTNGRGILKGDHKVPRWGAYAICVLPYYDKPSDLKGPRPW